MLKVEAEIEWVRAGNIYKHIHCSDAARNERNYSFRNGGAYFPYDKVCASVHRSAEKCKEDTQEIVFVNFGVI